MCTSRDRSVFLGIKPSLYRKMSLVQAKSDPCHHRSEQDKRVMAQEQACPGQAYHLSRGSTGGVSGEVVGKEEGSEGEIWHRSGGLFRLRGAGRGREREIG